MDPKHIHNCTVMYDLVLCEIFNCILVCQHVDVVERCWWSRFADSVCHECINERTVSHITHTALSLLAQHEIVANFRHWSERYITASHHLERKPVANI
jgi:hypothetical protein